MNRINVLGEATEATLAWSPGHQSFRVPRGAYVALMLVVMLGALTALAVSPAEATTVKGKFQYEDIDPNPDPDTNKTTVRPIVGARVEIWRFRPRGFLGVWTWGHEATATTDANGSISVDMPFAKNGVVYGVRVFAMNDAAIVLPNDVLHPLPFHREPGEDDGQIMHKTESSPSSVLDFSYTFHGWSSQHFNIAEVARHGKAYADARRAPGETDPIPPATFQPTSASFGNSSYYNAPVDTVVINSDDVNYDYLILHEYAHYLEERISSFAPAPSKHNGCTVTEQYWPGTLQDIAWMEGFADYFAQAVGRSVPEGTLTGVTSTPSTERLESPYCAGLPNSTIPGDAVEIYVAGTLWDLFDDPEKDYPPRPDGTPDPRSKGEAHDTLARMDQQIFEIFDRELDKDGVWPTITHFRHAWMDRGLPGEELSRIMVQLGIPLRENYGPTANAGADQTVEEGTAVTLNGNRSSDPDLNSLNFTWTQVSGPPVTLVNPSSETPSFIAPRLSSESATLLFRLVVSDGTAPPSSPDEVAIKVLDTGPLDVTKSPREAIISAGTLRTGAAGRLRADDNAYFEVNSTQSGTRRTSWYGRFAGVSNDLGDLRITYKGKNSASCSQTVDVYRWTDSTWVPLSQRSVGTTEVKLADLAPRGAASDYVSGASGLGEVRVRVGCTRSASSFYSSGDLLQIKYELP